jgi:L-cystine uptake protein TcyP (sodium:dicarboxylate symporter family)
MRIAITFIASVILFCIFIPIAMYLASLSMIVIVWVICFAAVATAIGILVGVAAVIAERIERRRELAHGG